MDNTCDTPLSPSSLSYTLALSSLPSSLSLSLSLSFFPPCISLSTTFCTSFCCLFVGVALQRPSLGCHGSGISGQQLGSSVDDITQWVGKSWPWIYIVHNIHTHVHVHACAQTTCTYTCTCTCSRAPYAYESCIFLYADDLIHLGITLRTCLLWKMAHMYGIYVVFCCCSSFSCFLL